LTFVPRFLLQAGKAIFAKEFGARVGDEKKARDIALQRAWATHGECEFDEAGSMFSRQNRICLLLDV
jgi:hypothetical protein